MFQFHHQFGAHPHSTPLSLFKQGHTQGRREARATSLVTLVRTMQRLVRPVQGRSRAVPLQPSRLLSKGLISPRRLSRTFLLIECMRQQHTVATLQFSKCTVGSLGDLVMLSVHRPVRSPTMTLGFRTARLESSHPCAHLHIARRASYLAPLHLMLPVHTSMNNLTLRVARTILRNLSKPTSLFDPCSLL